MLSGIATQHAAEPAIAVRRRAGTRLRFGEHLHSRGLPTSISEHMAAAREETRAVTAELDPAATTERNSQ